MRGNIGAFSGEAGTLGTIAADAGLSGSSNTIQRRLPNSRALEESDDLPEPDVLAQEIADELQTAFQTANASFLRMAKDSSMAVNNPLAFYRLHSDDASAIGSAISMGQKIGAAQGSKDTLGFSLRLNYTPAIGFTIYGGVGLRF